MRSGWRRLATERRWLARQRAGHVAPPPEPDPWLWDAVARLGPRARTAVALRYVADLSEAEVAGATTEEAAIIWNPLSASLTSGCALSGCLGSACTQSGCFGSVCIVSGCAGSLCELSGCAGSVCIGSLCVGSVCAGSGCVGSVCAGRCAVEVEGTVEVGAATTSQTAAAGWWERVDVAAGD